MYGYHIIFCHLRQHKNISEACQNKQKRPDTTKRAFRLTRTVEGLKV